MIGHRRRRTASALAKSQRTTRAETIRLIEDILLDESWELIVLLVYSAQAEMNFLASLGINFCSLPRWPMADSYIWNRRLMIDVQRLINPSGDQLLGLESAVEFFGIERFGDFHIAGMLVSLQLIPQ